MASLFITLSAYFLIVLIAGALIGKIMSKSIHREEMGIEEKMLDLFGVDAFSPMSWKRYLFSVLTFSFTGVLFLFIILITQPWHPINTKAGLPFLMAFNIAVSFVTNTNWQNYIGESNLTHISQMLGLGVQNFLSAATGIAVLFALIRGLVNKETSTLGNFWGDISRISLRILLPLSFFLALFLIYQGVPQTLQSEVKTVSLEGKEITLPLGPVASQIAIKMNGSNGGGFFNANASHPFENPTPLSNFVQLISMLLIPVACVFLWIFSCPYKKEGLPILFVMLFLLILGLSLSLWGQINLNPFTQLPFLEGTETRFSIAECSIWSVVTTAVSNGSVNCMHSSLSPLAQIVAMFNMMTGEIIFGGVGSGLYGMLLYVILTVFLAGLMVGRTPEYLGKKIQSKEIMWTSFALLSPGLLNLLFSALALNTNLGQQSLSHIGPHGLSEVLYAFSSSFGNNGSAFAGLNANTAFYNILTSIGMLFGRFAVICSVLIIAGSLGLKKVAPRGPGSLQTDTVLFAFLLVSTIIIVGALTFFPALALSSIAEQLMLNSL